MCERGVEEVGKIMKRVSLFFFISGCMENFNSEKNIGKYIIKKFKHIMLPFWLFSFISIVMQVIIDNSGLSDIKDMIIKVAQGAIRNKFFNGSIWFLTCLFVIAVLFQILKLLKNRAVIVGVCIVMFMIAEYVIKPRPISEPHWIYSIDSAFYYIIYYAIGYVVFPVVADLFKMDAMRKWWLE